MKNSMLQLFVVTAGTAGLIAGCAHHGPPPTELEEARAIYARASAGPAARHAPARLQLAKQALASAELAYGAAPPSEVQDRAYVAIRRAEAAEAEASIVAANERRTNALRELATLTGVHADRARAELGVAQQRATEAGQRAELAQAQVAAEQSRTLSAQQLAEQEQQRARDSESRLAAEQQARAEAEAKAQQALDELGRLAQVKQEARGLVITLSGQVLFVTNQAKLLPAAEKSLDGVATALKQVDANAGTITIEGHTDSTGGRDYNLELARRRAEAVRDYLVDKGVRSELFTVAGVGPDRPVANNRTAEGRANNRRVEIVIPSTAMARDKLAPAGGVAGTSAPGAASPAGAREAAPGTTSGTGRTPASATMGASGTAGGVAGGAAARPGASTPAGTPPAALPAPTPVATPPSSATTPPSAGTTTTPPATTPGASTGTSTTPAPASTPAAPTTPPRSPQPSNEAAPTQVSPPPMNAP